MESEKVKKIKKALECQSTLSLPKCEKCDYKFGIVCKTEKLLEDALTLINELESENDTLHTNLCEYRRENQQLKDENERLKEKCNNRNAFMCSNSITATEIDETLKECLCEK